jgi:hypothetical protein
MPLWKITDKGPTKVKETKFKQEKLLEEHLEDWIAADPSILGEPLLIFGRQVIIPDTKDRLDLLAVDPHGSIAVIELKRGHLKDPVDMQSLRYASYVSKWRFEDFENVARNHFGKVGDAEFNFNEMFESFCSDSGIDDIPDLNQDQRIIIIGSAVREKLGSVALWLRDHSIDIKLIEIQAYKDGDELLKKTGAGNLFMVFGEPDVDIRKVKNKQIVVEIKGVDVYDPTTGQIRSSSTNDIACWFIDTDYNGESFFVRHAYFTGAEDPYDKLKRALRSEINESAWSSLYSTVSQLFDKPESGKIAVKVINHYGDEVLKVFEC